MLETVLPAANSPMAAIEAASVGAATLMPEFIEGFDHGRRFGLWVLPGRGARQVGSILVIQPFGDEANLSRRVVVAQAMRLAERGWTSLVLDLYGTGDSEGETDVANFDVWRADLLRASRLARERGPGLHVVWGIRMGALLGAELALALDQLVDGYVFWQAPLTGAAALANLLKLSKVGALGRAKPAGAAQDPEHPSPGDEQSGTGVVNLGGYRLQRELLGEFSLLTMRPPPLSGDVGGCPTLFLGIQRNAGVDVPVPKSSSELAQAWLNAGFLAALRVVAGDPFWSSMEPSTPVAAFEATEAFLMGLDGRG